MELFYKCIIFNFDNSIKFLSNKPQVLAEKLPELLDFPKDLVSLEASTKVLCFLFFISPLILVGKVNFYTFGANELNFNYDVGTIEIFGRGNASH